MVGVSGCCSPVLRFRFCHYHAGIGLLIFLSKHMPSVCNHPVQSALHSDLANCYALTIPHLASAVYAVSGASAQVRDGFWMEESKWTYIPVIAFVALPIYRQVSAFRIRVIYCQVNALPLDDL